MLLNLIAFRTKNWIGLESKSILKPETVFNIQGSVDNFVQFSANFEILPP
jgi:hypothetical protein